MQSLGIEMVELDGEVIYSCKSKKNTKKQKSLAAKLGSNIMLETQTLS